MRTVKSKSITSIIIAWRARFFKRILQNYCNISAARAIIAGRMVCVMAQPDTEKGNARLVRRARTDPDALGELYRLYYNKIFAFCVYRLFSKEPAEEVTSMVFLAVARRIRYFAGQTESDWRNWLYRIAANQTNAYIRKTSRRKRIFAEAARERYADSFTQPNGCEFDWATLYPAIRKLKLKYQTIVTLRFFEGLSYDEIGRVLDCKPATARVTTLRALKKLKKILQTVVDGES